MRAALALSFFLLAACSAEKRTIDTPAIVDAGADVMVELDASPDCEMKPYYVDKDGDHFAGIDPVMSCERLPEIWRPTDCHDDNPDVFPGQTQFFDEPIPGRFFTTKPGHGWDYNCDGKAELEYTEKNYEGPCRFAYDSNLKPIRCNSSGIGIFEAPTLQSPYVCGGKYTLIDCNGCAGTKMGIVMGCR